MSKARFHSLRGEKSALIAVRPNDFAFGHTFVYINRKGVLGATKMSEADLKETTWEDEVEFNIPDGYKIVTMVDENGDPRTTKEGEELKTLVW